MHLTSKATAYCIVIMLYAVSVLCRLPTLNRPLSKHHEFNTASVLTGIEAWQQRGGGAKYAFVPFFNYANPGDYVKDNRWALDGKGNCIYLSYGPGMFVIPYFFFEILNLAVTPLNLQLVNLGFLLVAVLILFQILSLVCKGLRQQYSLAVAGCFLFLFNPCILWFLGNGYVNVTIVLPFLLGAIHQAIIIYYHKKRSYLVNYLLLVFFILAGIYIDWILFFAAIAIGCFDVVKRVRQRKFPVMAAAAAVGAVAGVVLIFWQYAQYLPLPQITNYWKERFFTRSIESTELGLGQKWLLLLTNLITGYLPVLVLGFLFLFSKKDRAVQKIPDAATAYLRLSGGACLLYNLIFFNWSCIHDFSLVPASIFISFMPVYLLINKTLSVKHWVAFALCFAMAIGQYYYINRPGKTAQSGDPYDQYKIFGETIKASVQPDEMIFMNSQSPIVNYYAKRFTFKANSLLQAREMLRKWGYPKGVWIQGTNYHFQPMQRITPE